MSGEHAWAAFRLGAALFMTPVAIAGGYALARGPDMNLQMFFSAAAPEGGFSAAATAETPRPRSESDGADSTRSSRSSARSAHASRSSHNASAVTHWLGGTPVCVRLCDGLHFPAIDSHGGDAGCAAQCPDAPVALYSMPGDDINLAVSLTGAKYTDLPVAGRHTTTYNNTCTCHTDLSYAHTAQLKKDRTLRRGDVLATRTGFLIVEGSHSDGSSDFAALEQSRSVTKDVRENLSAMERASYLARQADPLAINVADPSQKKRGKVFVTDGAGKGPL